MVHMLLVRFLCILIPLGPIFMWGIVISGSVLPRGQAFSMRIPNASLCSTHSSSVGVGRARLQASRHFKITLVGSAPKILHPTSVFLPPLPSSVSTIGIACVWHAMTLPRLHVSKSRHWLRVSQSALIALSGGDRCVPL